MCDDCPDRQPGPDDVCSACGADAGGFVNTDPPDARCCAECAFDPFCGCTCAGARPHGAALYVDA